LIQAPVTQKKPANAAKLGSFKKAFFDICHISKKPGTTKLQPEKQVRLLVRCG
jgi:hypothetical protein